LRELRDLVPSLPSVSLGCRCGNVFVDVDAGRLSNRLPSSLALVSVKAK
jgi:hypothetical protein